MGCDIHLIVERQVGDKWIAVRLLDGYHNHIDGKWSSPAARSRSYERFAALAGVRGDGPVAKGLPDDLSETARFLIDDYGSDGHSHSWLPVEEAVDIFLKTQWKPETNLSEFNRKYPAYFYFGLEESDLNKARHRLVFWFDN